MPHDKESVQARIEDICGHDGNEGYVIDARGANHGEVKIAKDGHTILIPQASDDPHDPLNWSIVRKHVVLLIVSATAFLPDYGSATGAVTLLPQAALVLSIYNSDDQLIRIV